MKRSIVTTLIFVACIAALSAFQFVMQGRIESYLHSGLEIPLFERVLFALAMFWKNFWWVLIPPLVVAAYAAARLSELIGHKLSSKRAGAF